MAKISLVGFLVYDLDRATELMQTLGLWVVSGSRWSEEGGRGCFFQDDAGQCVELFEWDEEITATKPFLAFECQDLDAFINQLQAAGFELDNFTWGSEGTWVAFQVVGVTKGWSLGATIE